MAVLFAAFVLATPASADSEVGPQELSELMRAGSVVVVDVRTRGEFAAGHIPGALNVPYDQVSGRVDEIRRHADGRPVVLYCHSGRRARIADPELLRQGVSTVFHLRGQLSGWRAAGLPLER